MRLRYRWIDPDPLCLYILRAGRTFKNARVCEDPPKTSLVVVPAVESTLPAILDALTRLEAQLRTMGARPQAEACRAITMAVAGVRTDLEQWCVKPDGHTLGRVLDGMP